MKTKLRRVVAINIVLSLLAAVAALGAFELHARFTYAPEAMSVVARYAVDDVVNHAFIPNQRTTVAPHPDIPEYEFVTNELGLRIGEPYSIQKPAGTFRIVFCGDSFVEGYAFEKTLPARLQAGLQDEVRDRMGLDLQVIHAGTGTYSPILHYFNLRSKLLALEPDVVIVAIDATDARDDYNYGLLLYEVDGEPAGVRSEMSEKLDRLREGMIAELSFGNRDRFIALTSKFSVFARREWDKRALVYADRYKDLISDWAHDYRTGPFMFDVTRPQTKQWVDDSAKWVQRIDGLTREHSAQLVVTMYPYREQIGDPKLHGYIERYANHAARLGIPFHDATPGFERLEDPSRAYLPGDHHFNYEGQGVWARSLVDFMKARLPAE